MHHNGNPPSRRTKAKGKPGIYYREARDGQRIRRRYEVTYLDSDGRRRWQTVPGFDNLDEAEATLVGVKGKLHNGERVAPSRLTFNELADAWLSQMNLGERTLERYESNLRLHLRPRFGRRRAQEVTVDDVARLIASLQGDGKAGWTIRNVITTLSSLMSWAVRRGHVPANPVRQLERAERPSVGRKRQCIFEREEIGKVIAAATPLYRPVIATAFFSGMRLMELLGLRWQDVDFENGYLHVRNQLRRRDGSLKGLKTTAGERDVVLFPELASLLRRHKAASPRSQPHHLVFPSSAGTPFNWRNIETRGFDQAVARANLDPREVKPVMNACRHTFASMLIAQGLDVVFISRQLGHSSPATTLRIYAHLFDRANHADGMRRALSAGFGTLLDGNALETTRRNGTQRQTPKKAQLAAVGG